MAATEHLDRRLVQACCACRTAWNPRASASERIRETVKRGLGRGGGYDLLIQGDSAGMVRDETWSTAVKKAGETESCAWGGPVSVEAGIDASGGGHVASDAAARFEVDGLKIRTQGTGIARGTAAEASSSACGVTKCLGKVGLEEVTQIARTGQTGRAIRRESRVETVELGNRGW